jgi:putative membrane-bound dehydrogenase-like protein
MRGTIRSAALVCLALLPCLCYPQAAPAEDLGLRVAPGFRVTLYADHELANDIFAMTLDSHGRVVVTGPGYIKVLHDTKGAGKADKATVFATPPTGGMGLCFDGNDLYFCGAGWLSRYRDRDGKGRADGPPEHLLPLAYGEHGGHAMRKGPDGWWYVIGGNDSGIDKRHVTLPHSPIQNPEAGALLRLTPDCKQSEVIAHGFRNPYDFDFNEAGDLFTYDSDVERDYFLPWYTPTRMYHIGYAMHHGWRLPSYLRSWCRKDYYLDTVDILWPVGRGSPTGVVCYRHTQFPEHYRGGIFALDWTFGKVYFFPLQPEGASYRTQPEVFLESVGTSGFDPTDVVVAPDGSLFICMGGRGTRGAVYRVEYVGEGKMPRKAKQMPQSDLEAVLRAPQPLDAWSRARWEPLARKLGPHPFGPVIVDESWDEPARIRAVEIMTELFSGLPHYAAAEGAKAPSSLVRSRIAWSLGRAPIKGFDRILAQLAGDPHQHVQCTALEAFADRFHLLPSEIQYQYCMLGWLSSDKRTRQAWARLASKFPVKTVDQLPGTFGSPFYSPIPDLNVALALHWKHPEWSTAGNASRQQFLINRALAMLKLATGTEVNLEVVRLLMLALGDYQLKNPAVEIHTAYSLQSSLQGEKEKGIVAEILNAIRPLFPSGDTRLDEESSRLLAMLEDDNPNTPRKVAAFWTERSSPTQDMHYLVVFSRLRGPRTPELTAKVAKALLGLHHKLEGREQRTKQTWETRLAELVTLLLRRDPRLADELLRHADFVNPGHVAIAASLDGEHRLRAARLFLAAVRKDANFPWSGSLIDLLALLPLDEIRNDLRAQWDNFGLRDAILLRLAVAPQAVDREKFLLGLDSVQPQVVHASLSALEALPRDPSPKNLVPLLRLLRRLQQEPREGRVRTQTVALIVRQAGRPFSIKEETTDAAALKRTYLPVFQWFEKQHPTLVRALNDTGSEDPAVWDQLLKRVNWKEGDAVRGEALFRNRACQTCHAGARALGPDLTGVTSRFSREDLFTAIIYPSRDVAPAYRTSVVETRQGQLYTGIVAFESADGIILQTGATTTVRLANDEIVSRVPSNRSLMPDGLLRDLKPADLADLYSYLQTLKPKVVKSGSP